MSTTGQIVNFYDSTGNPILALQNQIGVINGFYLPSTASTSWQRTPEKFVVVNSVTISTTTPGTALWTPSSKKFRLLGFTLATTNAGTMQLYDGSTNFFIYYSPSLSSITFMFPNNGYPSIATNNSLLAVFSAATTNALGTFWGTEE